MTKIAKDVSDREDFMMTLDGLAREGARRLIAAALEAEVAAYVARYSGERDAHGHALVVRNGTAKARGVTVGSGTFTIEAPRVNDKRVIDGERQKFTSAILPPYLRRSKNVSDVLPLLYLRGLSTGDFQDALKSLLGENAPGLSSSNITRLVSVFSDEREAWQKRSLEGSDYVYIWVDGIHFNVRLEDERVATLVVIGAKVDGTKEVIALEDGYRESKESWLFLLRNLRDRGMKAPNVAVGDGALGFWPALAEVFPTTLEQRCWVHKIVNVLDKLPKSMQSRAKAHLHDVVNAPTRQEANKAIDAFQSTYGDKYPKATKCLLDSRNELLVFFDFPAAHWKHLRTTNPIESTFATVRLRTRVTKGPGSRSAGLAMVYKLLITAQMTWRKLSSPELLTLVRNGVAFEDGVRVERPAAPANTKPMITKVRSKKKNDYAEKAAA